jgi:hypothetical protein
MADPEVLARLEALESQDPLRTWMQLHAPPPLSEKNRLLAEAWHARQAELRALREAEEAKVRAAEDEAKVRAFEAWLAAEPIRDRARADAAAKRARLAELDVSPDVVERKELESQIWDLEKIAESK